MLKPYKVCPKFILFFILIISFEYSKEQVCNTDCTSSNGLSCVDSSSNSCPSNCKPKYGSTTTNTCYDCSGISGKYYTIDSNGNCLNQCFYAAQCGYLRQDQHKQSLLN